MRGRWLVLFGVLAAAPASAQPFIFPLHEPQKNEAGPPPSAPPVAPPQAGPTLPAPSFAGSGNPSQQEEASDPDPAPPR